MSEDTIFREVDEELRRDRLRHGWRRYGFYVIGAAVLVVLVVAANEGWSWWQGSNAARSSDQFYAALTAEDGGDLAAAGKALDTLIAQGTGQYPELAKFKQAALLARQGKTADAQAAYDALASSEGNSRLKGLALLFAANLLVDKGDVNAVKSRIEGLLTPDNPLHNAANETLGLTEYKAGDVNAARDSFAAVLAAPDVSNDTRGRMQLYIGQLVAQGAAPPGGVAGATAPVASPLSDTSAAPGATPTSAPTAADATTPVGVESGQQSVPDAALDLATPAPASTAPATTAPDSSIPMLSTGAGLPSAPLPDAASTPAGTVSQPAVAPATSATPAPTPAPAPATPVPGAPAPAPAATAPPVTTAPAGK